MAEQKNKMNDAQMEILNLKLDHLSGIVTDIKEQIKSSNKEFVTKDQFRPVKTIAYGFAGLILTSFIVSLINVITQ